MYYDYRLSNGDTLFGVFEWTAEEYAKEHGVTILHKEYVGRRANRPRISNKSPRIRDGFTSGFQPSLGEYCDSYSEYKKKCKERGLVEVGNDHVEPNVYTKKENTYFTDDNIKYYKEMGAELSDNEADNLKECELKDDYSEN